MQHACWCLHALHYEHYEHKPRFTLQSVLNTQLSAVVFAVGGAPFVAAVSKSSAAYKLVFLSMTRLLFT